MCDRLGPKTASDVVFATSGAAREAARPGRVRRDSTQVRAPRRTGIGQAIALQGNFRNPSPQVTEPMTYNTKKIDVKGYKFKPMGLVHPMTVIAN
jgi:hypothetical protein